MRSASGFGVCGLDCTRCGIHLRAREELDYWKGRNVDPSRVACDGCRSDRNGCHWSADCTLLQCCLYEKKLDFCGECPDFPCGKVAEWVAGLKHHREIVEKMADMRKIGKDAWIRQRGMTCEGEVQ